MRLVALGVLLCCVISGAGLAARSILTAEIGPRPFYLVESMKEGPLKEELLQCRGPFTPRFFSFAHRGAPLQFPEHSREGYLAAARMGAGAIECDVTFTKDRQLVCRHSQCDLHRTTDILARPELAAKCSQGFEPADPVTGRPASAKCCTSDLTLDEFKSLHPRMDGENPHARTVAEYLVGTPRWRTDLYAAEATIVAHKEYIALVKSLGRKFVPELKTPDVPMPFGGDYTQQDFAQQMIDEYKQAGVDPGDVYPQSFRLDDVLYWLKAEPAWGRQAIYLDGRREGPGGFDSMKPESWKPSMEELGRHGVRILGAPTWKLVTTRNGKIIPSRYALSARQAGLKLVAWSFERSGPLARGGDQYYQSIAPLVDRDGDALALLDVLGRDVGVIGAFSDWPATMTFYANCMGLK